MLERRHKYGAKPTEVDGIRFDSLKEAKRYGELVLLQRAGAINGLERQVSIPLMGQNGPIVFASGRPARYVADFRYWDVERQRHVIEDAKGFRTPEYKLKQAILAAQGVTVEEV